jgi:hypothetical protein
MNITCPFCDSNKVEKIEVKENFTVPFCEDAVIPHTTFRCENCEEEGDFDNSLDKALTIAIAKANIASAPKLMDELTQIGITMTYLEKALRLPFRTTARWKRGRISRSSLALLRIIRFSPSLLEVADDNFSHEASARYQISRPLDFLKRNTSNPGYLLSWDQDQFEVSFTGNIHSSAIPSVRQEVIWEASK